MKKDFGKDRDILDRSPYLENFNFTLLLFFFVSHNVTSNLKTTEHTPNVVLKDSKIKIPYNDKYQNHAK